jgi:hypothetical protein
MGEFSEARWSALTTRAAEIGAEHGRNAAQWVDVDGDGAAQRWVTGISDGDPMVLDALPDNPLSGEYADSYGMADLYRDLGIEQRDDTDDAELCRAYEDAYSGAVQDEVERRARYQLA